MHALGASFEHGDQVFARSAPDIERSLPRMKVQPVQAPLLRLDDAGGLAGSVEIVDQTLDGTGAIDITEAGPWRCDFVRSIGDFVFHRRCQGTKVTRR